MSSRVFQSIVLQMKECTDRVIGVIDDQGTVRIVPQEEQQRIRYIITDVDGLEPATLWLLTGITAVPLLGAAALFAPRSAGSR